MIVKSFIDDFSKEVNPQVGLFRLALGAFFLFHYLSMAGEINHYFGPNSMINPSLMVYPTFSFLFNFWNDSFITLFFYFLIFLFSLFSLGILPKWLLPLLFVFQLSFHNANPLIIHEPHQLGNLFLLFFFFLPLHSSPFMRINLKFQIDDRKFDNKIFLILILFFGIYYFLAGIKKIPDPLWLKGEAIHQILSFPYFKNENWINLIIIDNPTLSSFFTYFSLIFEIGFIFFIFTRFRPFLIIFGVLFHLGIELTMDVGGFSQIMWVWYMALLDRKTLIQIDSFLSIKKKFK